MNKKHLIILGILVVIVATFTFSIMKGTVVENVDLNNLGSSSLGVPLTNDTEEDCAFGIKICGETSRVLGYSTLKNTMAGAQTSAINDCVQAVSTAKKNRKDCVDSAKRDCKEPDLVCSLNETPNDTPRPCRVISCTEYRATQACTFDIDNNGGLVIPGSCIPVKTPPNNLGWKCIAGDGIIFTTLHCVGKDQNKTDNSNRE